MSHLDGEQAVQADVLRGKVLAPHVGEHEDQAGAAEADPEEGNEQRNHLHVDGKVTSETVLDKFSSGSAMQPPMLSSGLAIDADTIAVHKGA